jgi:hypothetical protein
MASGRFPRRPATYLVPGPRPRDATFFVPAPDLSRSTGLSAAVPGDPTDPSPYGISLPSWQYGHVVAGPPSVPLSPRMTAARRSDTGRGCGFLAVFPPAPHGLQEHVTAPRSTFSIAIACAAGTPYAASSSSRPWAPRRACRPALPDPPALGRWPSGARPPPISINNPCGILNTRLNVPAPPV